MCRAKLKRIECGLVVALNCIKFHSKKFSRLQIVVRSSFRHKTYTQKNFLGLAKKKRFRTVIIIKSATPVHI